MNNYDDFFIKYQFKRMCVHVCMHLCGICLCPSKLKQLLDNMFLRQKSKAPMQENETFNCAQLKKTTKIAMLSKLALYITV